MNIFSLVSAKLYSKTRKIFASSLALLALLSFVQTKAQADACKFNARPMIRSSENTFGRSINYYTQIGGAVGGSYDAFLSGQTQTNFTSRLRTPLITYSDNPTFLKFGPNKNGFSIGQRAVEPESIGLEPDPKYLRLPVVHLSGMKYFSKITRDALYATILGQNDNSTLLLGNFSQETPGYYRTHTFIAKTSTNYQIEDLTPYADRSEAYAINSNDSVVGKSFGDIFDYYDNDQDGWPFLYRKLDSWAGSYTERLSPPLEISDASIKTAVLNDNDVVVAAGNSIEGAVSYDHLILWPNGNRVPGKSIYKVRSDAMRLQPTGMNKKGEVVGFDPLRNNGFYYYNGQMFMLDDVVCPNSNIPANSKIVHVGGINEGSQIVATMKGNWGNTRTRWDYSAVILYKVSAE